MKMGFRLGQKFVRKGGQLRGSRVIVVNFLGLMVKSKSALGEAGVEGDPTGDSNWVTHFDCKVRPTGREKLLFVGGFPK